MTPTPSVTVESHSQQAIELTLTLLTPKEEKPSTTFRPQKLAQVGLRSSFAILPHSHHSKGVD